MANKNATDAVSRRNVLKTAGRLIVGSTMLAGLGAGRGAAETEEGLQIEIREANEEYIAVEVAFSDRAPLPTWYLGHADRFVIHDDEEAVSLPEDTGGLANPVDAERLDEQTYRMYFHTREIAWPKEYEEGEEVTLGLGGFPERTVPEEYFDTARFEPAPASGIT